MGFGSAGGFWRKQGGIPVNPCGTGSLYPEGWRFLHDEVSGGLGSWGNMLKVSGFNSFGATISNASDGSANFCYKNGEIDFDALDAFFTENADVDNQYDQLGFDDLIDGGSGLGYIKSQNDLNFSQRVSKVSGLNPMGVASKNLGDSWSICYVLNYTSLPAINIEIATPFSGSNRLRVIWSGNGVSLIVRFESPSQGYLYNGLRNTGTKMIVFTYDGTSPINRSGLNLYWNGVLETPDGIYNSGSPPSNLFTELSFGLGLAAGGGNDGYFYEADFFDHALDSTEIAAIKEIYEQKYTFS